MKKNKTELLYISYWCPFPLTSGGKVGSWYKIQELSTCFDIYLCGLFEDGDQPENDTLRLYTKESAFFRRKRRYFLSLFSLFTPITIASRRSKQLRQYVKDKVNDGVSTIVLDSLHMLDAIKAIRGATVNIIINEHNYEEHLFKTMAAGSSGWRKMLFRIEARKVARIERTLLKRKGVKGLVFVSDEERQDYCRKNNVPLEKTCYIPVHYPDKFRQSVTNEKSIDILCVSNFVHGPNEIGVRWFLDKVFPSIIQIIPSVSFVLVGKRTDVVKEKYDSLYPHNFSCVGQVDALDSYYHDSKILVIPLFEGGGVKIKILEAASFGIPVVATLKTLEGTVFDETMVFVANEPDAFAEKCIQALKSCQSLDVQDMVLRFHQAFLAEYSFEEQAKKYCKFVKASIV